MHFTKQKAEDILKARAKNLITEDHIGSIINTKVTKVSKILLDKNDSRYRIVNFPIISPYYANLAQEFFDAGEYDDAINSTVSHNVYLDNRDGVPKKDLFIPAEGSSINCEVGTFTTEDGEQAIAISALIPLEKKAMSTFSFSFGKSDTKAEIADVEDILGGKK